METAHNFNERTPLLGATSNEQSRSYVISETSIEQTPLGKSSTSNGLGPLGGSCAPSNGLTSPLGQETSASDSRPPTVSRSKTSEQETNEVSLEEIAQALCSAWRRNSQQEPHVHQDYFATKELYAMHLAWKNVTSGKHCPLPAHTIAEAVAEAVARVLCPGASREPEHINYLLHVHSDKYKLSVGLLRDWKRITEGVGFPVRYIETVVENPDEQPLPVSEFWCRQVELYGKVHDFILSGRFQCFLHTLLIIWPTSLLVVGSKYVDCPVSHCLSYLLISLGCIGCLAIFVRQGLKYLMLYAQYSYDWYREWIGLRLIEFIFLIVFIVQVFHFFGTYPIAEPGPKQCAKNFYNAALIINYVSIPLVSMYLLGYFVIICVKRFDFWRWIFRHLNF